MKNYSFVQYSSTMKIPNGVYNGKYNSEPCLIRIENCIPVWVEFCGFIKHYEGQDEVAHCCVFSPKGIMHSNVELLLPAQELKFQRC